MILDAERAVVLSTARLELRRLDFGDAEFILELLNEPGFLQFIGDKGVRDAAAAREYLRSGPMESYARNGFGLYAVCLRDAVPVGICGLLRRAGLDDADVGFAFLRRHQSRGYASESAAAVLDHARRVLNLPRVVAITDPGNTASIAVLEKVGLSYRRMIRLSPEDIDLKLFACGWAE